MIFAASFLRTEFKLWKGKHLTAWKNWLHLQNVTNWISFEMRDGQHRNARSSFFNIFAHFLLPKKSKNQFFSLRPCFSELTNPCPQCESKFWASPQKNFFGSATGKHWVWQNKQSQRFFVDFTQNLRNSLQRGLAHVAFRWDFFERFVRLRNLQIFDFPWIFNAI